ncbi:MAG: DUF3566 domain-containing protein [Pseudonocardiaceae bacterium]
MTRPENTEQAEVQLASKEPGAADEPARQDPAPGSSGNGAGAPPWQRQWVARDDGQPRVVPLQVGAPEHARSGVREPADRQPAGGPAYGVAAGAGPPVTDPDFAPTTVRVGGYTPPERVLPAGSGSAPNSGSTASAQSRSGRVPRRTSLQLQRLEPWSVLKLSLVLSVAGFLAWMVAVGVLYGALAGMGVWDQINGTYSDLTSANNAQVSTELVSGGRVFGVALVIGLVNIVLLTALATVGSLIYNVVADLVGGVEVTLSEPD